jgi:toxin secretion/phage lysis holin
MDEINSLLLQLKEVDSYRLLVLPFVLMIIDFVTGIFNAWATGHLKSYKMREGLNKKFAEISMITISILFTWVLEIPNYISYGITVYVVIMELISICENLDKMGVPIPKFVKRALRNAEYKIQNQNERKGGEAN